MDKWFTVESIDVDTYVISEYRHWEETHCYLLIGTEYCLLIDTGLGIGNMKEVIDTLTDLPILVATTHIHWDHIGGHRHFQNIAVHELEKEWLSSRFPIALSTVKENLLKEPCEFPNYFDIDKYSIYQREPSLLLYDNDVLNLGGRSVIVLHTPGHSPGHICFYEKEKQYLYSGDLIYAGTLDAFYPSTNPVDFMDSIRKVLNLNINKVLPAHHNLNIDINLIKKIDKGFSELHRSGQLVQGNGMFYFNGFNIHI